MATKPADRQRRYRARLRERLAAVTPPPDVDPEIMTLAAIRAELAQHRKALARHPLQRRVDVLTAEIERRKGGKTE